MTQDLHGGAVWGVDLAQVLPYSGCCCGQLKPSSTVLVMPGLKKWFCDVSAPDAPVDIPNWISLIDLSTPCGAVARQVDA